MAKVIIGIHGLGNKPPKKVLEKWWKESLHEGLKRIGKNHTLPVFELIYWADIIYDNPLDPIITDRNNHCFLEEPYTISPKGFIFKPSKYRIKFIPYVIKYLKKIILNADFSLKYPNLTTSLVDYYFHELNIYYKEHANNEYSKQALKKKTIIEKAVSVLKKYKKDEILLIGHSMGSIIAYDIMSYELPNIKIHTFATIGSPLGQPFVISKIATRQLLKKNGTDKLKTPSSIILNWFNFSDIEDTIALNHKLSDEFCENSNGVKPKDILIKNDYIIQGKRNPHKSFGYLRSQEFSEMISAFIEEKKPSHLAKTLFNIKMIYDTTREKIKNKMKKADHD